MFFYLSLYIKTSSAWGTLGTLVGTFIGFLGGIYIPIGVLVKGVQNVMNVLPTAHGVTLIRRIYMAPAIDAAFSDLPDQSLANYSFWYGLDIYIGDAKMQGWQMLLSMVVFLVGFYVLSILKIRRSKL
jgi:multidrug/hemolysin transport system permease protein